MYYQNYEDYMRSILGYPMTMPINSNNTYDNYTNVTYEYLTPARNNDEILDLYPEIYKIIYPMVCKICEANTKPITRELVEKMTDEIYLNLESDPNNAEVVNLRVNLPTQDAKETSKTETSRKDVLTKTDSSKVGTNRANRESFNMRNNRVENIMDETQNNENRIIGRGRNRTLRDLIQILILNRLFGGNRPPRPRPPRPPRPPFPGGPGHGPGMGGGPRPPIQPRLF